MFSRCLIASALLSLLLPAACDGDGGGGPDVVVAPGADVLVDVPGEATPDVAGEDGIAEIGVDQGGEPDLGPQSIWEQLDWQPITAEDDATDDCTEEDATCAADLVAMDVAVQEQELFLRVSFAEDFPVDAGSFELFLFQYEPATTGLTIRHTPGGMRYWWAECDGGTAKHSGCHWSAQQAPQTLRYEWLDARHFAVRVDLGYAGLPGATAARFGVAAAPFDVNVTAEFTDRLPDALLVTATEVQGLAEVAW